MTWIVWLLNFKYGKSQLKIIGLEIALFDKTVVMLIKMLKAKIQELQVSESSIEYPGSIALPEELMKSAGIRCFEKVYVNNKSNGNRITTYAVKSKESGFVTVNGAASKLFQKGDCIHVLAYVYLTEIEAESYQPMITYTDDNNRLLECKPYQF